MKTAVTMYSFLDHIKSEKMSVSEFIAISSGYGADAVDLLEYYWQDKAKQVSEVPGLLKKYNIKIGAFCIGNNFIVKREERQKQIDYVKEGIKTAARLGASRLRIFGGSHDIPEGIRKEDRIGIIVQGIGECIDSAEKNGVTLVMENHGGIPVTSGELLEILQAVNSPYLKVNFDIGNFIFYLDESPVKAAEVLYPYIGHVHVKDMVKTGNPEEKYRISVIGEGIVPVKECLDFLKQKGYKDYVSIEYEAWQTVDSMIGVKKSLEYLKNILAEKD
jgi:sugar phosphate isomerase/epimerase